MRKLIGFLMLLFVFAILEVGHAALYDRGGGLIYDSIWDITWLQDSNYAQTSDYDSDGLMTWTEATAWASTLEYGGFDDWRLPTLPGEWWGFGSPGELGYMWYEYLDAGGGLFPDGTSEDAFGNEIIFSNLPEPSSYRYWSSSEFDSSIQPGLESAWAMGGSGIINIYPKDIIEGYAWAVRPGDPEAFNSVPEPATILLLLGSGLLCIWGFRKKFKK